MASSFSSKIGVLLAAAGSAIGLGSIWKFPYEVGENGGGAFLLLYIVCSLLFGLPLVMNEFLVGKLSGKSAYGAYRELSGSNKWQWMSWTNVICVAALMSFYFVVTGWCIYYMVEAGAGAFEGMGVEQLRAHFEAFEGKTLTMIIYAIIGIVMTGAVLWFDVNKGIERLSKILMPILFVILIVMAIHMMFIPGGLKGLHYLFHPDFSKITSKVILEAMGLSFFTLSVGVGALVTYGGYMPKDQNVTSTSIQMIVMVLIVSVLAAMIVFPAVFAYGFSPAEGPELTFVTLPDVFQNMVSPRITCTFFFALMCVAALTSTISLMEVMVAFICEASEKTKHPLNRHKSVLLVMLLQIVTNTLVVLSMTGQWGWLKVMGNNLFDVLNDAVSNYLMPLGALGISLYTGWFVPKARYQGSRVASVIYLVMLRWIVPLAIVIIFVNNFI